MIRALAMTDQPAPTPGTHEVASAALHRAGAMGCHAAAEVVRGRVDVGRARYGTVLQTFNGRDPLADLIQELGDAVQHATQADLEGRLPAHITAAVVVLLEQVCRQVER